MPITFPKFDTYALIIFLSSQLWKSHGSESDIIEDYPALENNDIKACLAFASRLSKVNSS
ncbi:MAG: DUF433 domain-containing protein [Bacteroidetes bacterium]|nr:DUF433 domain-containing protein [Bacteroidota bacterium]MCL6100907.1 DUF433 domain-containing protein [Bacteroidota bacterium]